MGNLKDLAAMIPGMGVITSYSIHYTKLYDSVIRKAEEKGIIPAINFDKAMAISEKENELIKTISLYPSIVQEAAESYSPAVIANYVYNLVKEYNQFYHDHSIRNNFV